MFATRFFLCFFSCCVCEILPWLSVRPVDLVLNPNSHRKFVISESATGREVTLRGACFEAEDRDFPPWMRSIDPSDYDGKCPANIALYSEPPICEVDFGKGKFVADTSALAQNDWAQARALGFNLVRLCLSWSNLEPSPGVYSVQYLDRVAQMVSWAEEQGIYVILDMHEDLYTKFIQPLANESGIPGWLTPGGGQDGAPLWATVTDGWPPLNIFGIGNFNLAVMKAFDNFYANKVVPGLPQGMAPGPGLQDHFIGAIAALAARFQNSSTVLGFEILNEPQVGTTINPIKFGRELLYPLYSRVAQAITGIRDGLPSCPNTLAAYKQPPPCAYPDLGIRDTRHILFAEPSSLRNELDFSAEEIPGPWTSYPNVVHTPHVYTHVFTIDQEVPWLNLTGKWPPSWEFAYDTAWAEANTMNASVLVSEFGTGADSDVSTVEPTLDEAERHGTGGTIWSWKSGCGTNASGDWCVKNISWTMYAPALPVPGLPNASIAPNSYLYPHRERMMSRVHARGVSGEVLGFFYNVSLRSYRLFANVSLSQAMASRAVVWGGMWATRVKAALQALGSPASDLTPLYNALSGHGAVSDIYIPRSLSPASANATCLAGPGCVYLGQCFWPDGSRSAFFANTQVGVYAIQVLPSNHSVSQAAAAENYRAAPPFTRTPSAMPSCALTNLTAYNGPLSEFSGEEEGGHSSSPLPPPPPPTTTTAASRVVLHEEEVLSDFLGGLPTLESLEISTSAAETLGKRILYTFLEKVSLSAEALGYPLDD